MTNICSNEKFEAEIEEAHTTDKTFENKSETEFTAKTDVEADTTKRIIEVFMREESESVSLNLLSSRLDELAEISIIKRNAYET